MTGSHYGPRHPCGGAHDHRARIWTVILNDVAHVKWWYRMVLRAVTDN